MSCVWGVTWQDNDGDTAMHWAVMKGALNAVKTLVRHHNHNHNTHRAHIQSICMAFCVRWLCNHLSCLWCI